MINILFFFNFFDFNNRRPVFAAGRSCKLLETEPGKEKKHVRSIKTVETVETVETIETARR